MNTSIKHIIMSIFLLLFSFSIINASVEVFSKYETMISIEDDSTIQVNKSLILKNVYDVGIVPGQIEFKIAKGTEGSIGNIQVRDVVALDRFGNEIKSQVRTTNDFSVIILDIYYPLLPGFEYEFNLEYTLDYEPGGIFFKSLQIPIRESTIPIEQGTFSVSLPDSSHFTYLEAEGVEGVIENNIASWEIRDNTPSSILFEYSYIPVKVGSFQGSYIFWIMINFMLVLFLVFEVRKEIKRIKNQYGE